MNRVLLKLPPEWFLAPSLIVAAVGVVVPPSYAAQPPLSPSSALEDRTGEPYNPFRKARLENGETGKRSKGVGSKGTDNSRLKWQQHAERRQGRRSGQRQIAAAQSRRSRKEPKAFVPSEDAQGISKTRQDREAPSFSEVFRERLQLTGAGSPEQYGEDHQRTEFPAPRSQSRAGSHSPNQRLASAIRNATSPTRHSDQPRQEYARSQRAGAAAGFGLSDPILSGISKASHLLRSVPNWDHVGPSNVEQVSYDSCGCACEPGCQCEQCSCGCACGDPCCTGCGRDPCGWDWGICSILPGSMPQAREFTLFGGVQAFKGPLDQNRDSGNFGIHEGFNWGGKLPWWTHSTVGYQIGYQLVHSQLHGSEQGQISDPHTQQFVTAGLFRRPSCGGLQYGVVWDMLRDERERSADFHQIRTEIGVINQCGREIGFQAAVHTSDTTESESQSFRTADQFLAYYRVHYERGGESRFFGGLDDNDKGIVGADLLLPVSDRWSLQGGFTYMIPEEEAGGLGAEEEAWNLAFNLVYHWGCRARRCHRNLYRPLFNVADNGSLIVDSRP